MVQDAIHKERDGLASMGIEVPGTDRSQKRAQHLLPNIFLTSPRSATAGFLLIGQGFENDEVHLSAWLYPGNFACDFRPVPELVEITTGPAMERTALCFVVGPDWIRNCEKPGISLPSPPYCPAMCEPSCEEADHLSLETGGDRGKLPQNPNDRDVELHKHFQYLTKNRIRRFMEHLGGI